MSREIKFRGQRVDGKGWVYGLVFNYSSRNQIKTYIQDGKFAVKNGSLYGWEVDKKSVGQFTGLTDKNGKEIYEGDIIQVNGKTQKYYDDNLFEPPETVEFELIVEVVYNDSIAAFDLSTIEADLNMKHWGFYGDDTQGHLEVIGNIHEKNIK